MDREQVFARPDEDIHSIIDSVVEAESDSIDLVVPSGARILQNIVDAYLLKDAVSQAGKKVRLVTNDVMGATFAERAGIETIPATEEQGTGQEPAKGEPHTVTAMARKSKKSGMSDIVPKKKKMAEKKKTAPKSTPRKILGSGTVGKKDVSESRFLKNYKQSKDENGGFAQLRSVKKQKGPRRLSTGKVVLGILALSLIIAGTVFARVLPKADVILLPVRDNQSFTLEVLVNSDASSTNVENGVIPGELLVEDKTVSGDFDATGSENLDDRARGTITIYNEFSAQPQTFIPSRFQTESGLVFRTQKTITVPGATLENGKVTKPGTINALVVADGGGEQYAIGPSRFSMPALAGSERGEKIYALSETVFSGGKAGENTIVAESDIERAYAALRDQAEDQIGIRSNLPDGLAVWDEARNTELAERKTSKQVGEAADTFTASVQVIERAVAYREDDLNYLIETIIIGSLEDHMTILPKSKEVIFLKPPVVDYEKGTVLASLQVNVDVINKINAESFRGAIVNKDSDAIKQIVNSYKGVEGVQIKLWPFWVNSVPSSKERVTVTIQGM